MDYKQLAEFPRVSDELVERARKYQAAILCDVAGRRGTVDARIRALNPKMKVFGPAFTVEVRPGDNLMFHVALAVARPGDVIVVDGKADSTCALFGDLMVTQAAAAKLGGFVVDAASRDTATLFDGAFPIFAAGTNPCGPTKGRFGTRLYINGTRIFTTRPSEGQAAIAACEKSASAVPVKNWRRWLISFFIFIGLCW